MIVIYQMLVIFFKKYSKTILNTRYVISTTLMIENPVRSPIVPPMAESLSDHLAALSFVIFSNFGVSKLIFT